MSLNPRQTQAVWLQSQMCLTVPENLHQLKGKPETEKPPACGCVLLVTAAKMPCVSQVRPFQLQLVVVLSTVHSVLGESSSAQSRAPTA